MRKCPKCGYEEYPNPLTMDKQDLITYLWEHKRGKVDEYFADDIGDLIMQRLRRMSKSELQKFIQD